MSTQNSKIFHSKKQLILELYQIDASPPQYELRKECKMTQKHDGDENNYIIYKEMEGEMKLASR